MNNKVTLSAILKFAALSLYLQATVGNPEYNCITTYQELKSSLRSNRTHNVQKMLDVFYPPNTAPSHVVFVTYCVRNNIMMPLESEGAIGFIEECYNNDTFTQFEFQWLTNTIPLLIDSDVFTANTFNFADLLQMNLSLIIADSFCDDIDGVTMLETLTVWVSCNVIGEISYYLFLFPQLKSYAQGDEDSIESYSVSLSNQNGESSSEGYLGLFDIITQTEITFVDDQLSVNNNSIKKFIIGLWLGITSITFALILHIGRVSAKTANGLNKVIHDLSELLDKLFGLPEIVMQFVQKEKTEEDDGSKNGSGNENGGHVKGVERQHSNRNDEVQYIGTRNVVSTVEQSYIEVAEVTVNFNENNNNSVVINNLDNNNGISAEISPAASTNEISNNSICEVNKEGANNSGRRTPRNFETIVIQNPLTETDLQSPNSNGPRSTIGTPVTYDHAEGNKLDKNTKLKLDHAFRHFAKSIQKLSTISTILLAGFLFYDIYIYVTKARKLSFDWVILFPIPFWFIIVTTINFIMFVITEITLFCRKKEGCCNHPKRTICYEIIRDFFVTMSTTTAPLFVFFHLFWLAIALTAFSVRLLSSATFYLPLAIFGLWLTSVIKGMLKQWKKLITLKRRKREGKRWLSLIGHFLYPMISLLFLPFWVLLLAMLNIFSDFLLVVANLENHSLLVVGGAIVVITGTAQKIAKHCSPQLDEDNDNETELA